jgi:hypothetical protein
MVRKRRNNTSSLALAPQPETIPLTLNIISREISGISESRVKLTVESSSDITGNSWKFLGVFLSLVP